jgi:hypothetical protein
MSKVDYSYLMHKDLANFGEISQVLDYKDSIFEVNLCVQ